MNKRSRFIIAISISVLIILIIGLTTIGVSAVRNANNTQVESQAVVASEPSLADTQLQVETESIYDQGVLVGGVIADSPAAAAGIRRGSIILEVDGQEIDSSKELIGLLAEKGGNTAVTIRVLNGDTPEEISVILAEESPYLGVHLVDSDFSSFGLNGDENCVCGFELPDGFKEFHTPPGDFDFDFSELHSGLIVTEVIEDSGAADAGLELGDIIQQVDGETVESVDQFIELIGNKNPGDSITLSILRGDESVELTATLKTHPDDESRAFLGVGLSNFPGMGRMFSPDGYKFNFEGSDVQTGAIIIEVVPETAAAEAELQPQDVIQAIDGESVTTIDSLVELIGAKNPGDMVTLSILRDGESQEVTVTLGANPDDESQAYLGVNIGAFFNVDVEQFNNNGEGSDPGQFFFHMRPDNGFGPFFVPPQGGEDIFAPDPNDLDA